MRPTRIELAGFLSYSEPTTLDLSAVTAGAIVGINGSGKTSLIEALGWCLYGKGRGRGPDDFVSDTATGCRVAVEFDIGAASYRVERERSSLSARKSSLTLAARSPDADTWHPVGGDRIAETQEAIEGLLGMDFDTWTASSFIAQGKADRFTEMKPRERKALLAEVLQLGQYQTLADRARETEREMAGEHAELLRRGEQIEEVLAGEEQARAGVDVAEDARAKATAAVDQAEGVEAAARARLDEARHAVSAAEGLTQRLGEMRTHRVNERARLEEQYARTATARDHARLAATEASGDLARLRGSAGLGTGVQAQAVAAGLEADRLEAEQRELGEECSREEAEARAEQERAAGAERSYAEAAERMQGLARTKDAECFTCGQPLTDEHRATMRSELEERMSALMRTRHENEGKAKSRLTRAEGLRSRAGALGGEASRLREKAVEASRAAERAAADAERIPDTERRLAAAEQASAEQEQTAERLAGEIEGLMETPSQERELELQVESAQSARHDLAVHEEAHRTAERHLANDRMVLTEAAAALGRAQEALTRFEGLRTEQAEVSSRAEALGAERFRWATLAQAFGPDGIPAFIIENAVPQIDQEANRLLSSLTDGRFSVRIESLRAKKTGGLKETLDIAVADETAERPLEELSGGERQCVDLALRIALSRLLAHRAGHPMETLILDEAFNALDVGRRQRAIEVMRSLLEEFRLLLFVTHDRDMAEAFPTRIRVSKDEGSSSIEVDGELVNA